MAGAQIHPAQTGGTTPSRGGTAGASGREWRLSPGFPVSVPFYNLLFNLSLDPGAEEPIYLQVSRRVAEVIQAGKLQPGAPMPGTRTLAKALGIGRNAAIAAYGELHAQGWIQTEVGFGTRVATTLPEFRAGRAAKPLDSGPLCGFEFDPGWPKQAVGPCGRVDLREPGPDPRLFPEEELARAFRRPVGRTFGRRLRNAPPQGPLEAREVLAEWLSERRAMPVAPTSILLTGGAHEGLGLIARNLFPPGSRVAVEDPGNPKAWATFQQAGLDLLPVPVDGEGIRPEALEDVCLRDRPRLLYLTPNSQYPTGAVLGAERRAAVLELAGRFRMAILEEDHAAELYYEERDWHPLAAADARGVVLHLGGFGHLLGGAFGLGYLTGPEPVIGALAQARVEEGAADVGLLAGVFRDLTLDGGLLRHIRRARTAYRARRDLAWEALRLAAGGALRPRRPASGLHLWMEGEADVLDAVQQEAGALGLALRSPRHWCLSPEGVPGLVFPFAQLDEAELGEVLALIRRARIRPGDGA